MKISLNLVSHLQRQFAWSERTFGPPTKGSASSVGIIDHIRRELVEIEANPTDLEEWIDVVILALDGAWRVGHTSEEIAYALDMKQRKNEGRKWPAIKDQIPGRANEHIKEDISP